VGRKANETLPIIRLLHWRRHAESPLSALDERHLNPLQCWWNSPVYTAVYTARLHGPYTARN